MLKIQDLPGAMPWTPTGALLIDPVARIGATVKGPPPPPSQTPPLDPALIKCINDQRV